MCKSKSPTSYRHSHTKVKSDYQKYVHITDKQFRLENGVYIYSLLNFKGIHVAKSVYGAQWQYQ